MLKKKKRERKIKDARGKDETNAQNRRNKRQETRYTWKIKGNKKEKCQRLRKEKRQRNKEWNKREKTQQSKLEEEKRERERKKN